MLTFNSTNELISHQFVQNKFIQEFVVISLLYCDLVLFISQLFIDLKEGTHLPHFFKSESFEFLYPRVNYFS